MNFSYILNIINELKKKKISANVKNILSRLNVGDEINEITMDILNNIILYALENEYVCKSTYNNNISYRVNEKPLNGECEICGEGLSPYSCEDLTAKKAKYVDYETFETTIEEIKDLKKKLNGMAKSLIIPENYPKSKDRNSSR